MNDMTWIAQTPIAHRGLHNSGSIPENSLAAVEAAIAHQYAIEIDIHQLADGSIVVFHDDDLRRMTGAEGKIAAQTAATVQQFRLGGTEQTIPLLVEVLDLVNGQVPLLIEIKSKGKDSVGPLEAAVVKTLKSYRGLYAIQAFNPYSLEWLKHHSPTVPRGQLSGDFRGEDLDWSTQFLLSNLLLNWVSDPQFIGPESLTPCCATDYGQTV